MKDKFGKNIAAGDSVIVTAPAERDGLNYKDYVLFFKTKVIKVNKDIEFQASFLCPKFLGLPIDNVDICSSIKNQFNYFYQEENEIVKLNFNFTAIFRISSAHDWASLHALDALEVLREDEHRPARM